MVRREGACPSPDACRPACAPSLSLSRPSGNRRTADLTAQMDDREQWYPPLSRSGDAEASSSGRDVLEASVVATRDQVRARFDAATRISGLPPRGPAPRGRRGSRRAGPAAQHPRTRRVEKEVHTRALIETRFRSRTGIRRDVTAGFVRKQSRAATVMGLRAAPSASNGTDAAWSWS